MRDRPWRCAAPATGAPQGRPGASGWSGRPDALALANLGGLLNQVCRFDEAGPIPIRAVALDPSCRTAWSNLGNTMVERQRHDDPKAAFSNALRLHPAHGPILADPGVALTACGAPAQALTVLDLALACEPDNAGTRCNRALALLANGDWAQGFADHAWRWRTRGASRRTPAGCRAGTASGSKAAPCPLHDEGGLIRFAAPPALRPSPRRAAARWCCACVSRW